MRIGIYANQLLEVAAEKEAAKQKIEVDRDYGNDMEHALILREVLNNTIEDPEVSNPIAAELDEIDKFWNKIRNNE